MFTLEGVNIVAYFLTAYEDLNKPILPFLIRSVFFVSKGNLFGIYYDQGLMFSCSYFFLLREK